MHAETSKGGDDISKILAVKRVHQLGHQLAAGSPDIADLYRAGQTQMQIAKRIQHPSGLKFYLDFLRRVVQFALRQLIPEDERKEIAKKHIRKRGEQAFKDKSGIHALSAEGRKEQALMRIKSYKKTVLFALSPEEIRKRASDALGSIMWEGVYRDPETGLDLGDYCFKLANDHQFWHKEGSKRGKPNYKLIAKKLNEIFAGKLPKSITPRRVSYYLNYRKKKRTKKY